MSLRVCSPMHSIAWSESVCLTGVEAPLAYIWEPDSTCAVVGLSQDVQRELRLEALREDGVAIVRRPSGGGAVILSPGVFCWGVIAPPDLPGLEGGLRAAYRVLTAPLADALHSFGIQAEVSGISDLSTCLSGGEAVKLAGTAQLRKRNAVLVHGSLLVDLDLSLLERYLSFPSKVPVYRAERSHTAFCRTVSQLTGEAVVPEDIRKPFTNACVCRGWQMANIPATLSTDALQLIADKFGRDGWNLRRERIAKSR